MVGASGRVAARRRRLVAGGRHRRVLRSDRRADHCGAVDALQPLDDAGEIAPHRRHGHDRRRGGARDGSGCGQEAVARAARRLCAGRADLRGPGAHDPELGERLDAGSPGGDGAARLSTPARRRRRRNHAAAGTAPARRPVDELSGERQQVFAARHVPRAADSHIPRRVAHQGRAKAESLHRFRSERQHQHVGPARDPASAARGQHRAERREHEPPRVAGSPGRVVHDFGAALRIVSGRLSAVARVRQADLARHGDGAVGRRRLAEPGRAILARAHVPAHAVQRAPGRLARQSRGSRHVHLAPSRSASRSGAARQRVVRPHHGREPVCVSVGRRTLRQSRPLRDGAAALPVHHRQRCGMRSVVCFRRSGQRDSEDPDRSGDPDHVRTFTADEQAGTGEDEPALRGGDDQLSRRRRR